MASFTEPILHVDMDAFFVEVERLRNPMLRGRPVVVGGASERGVVASASYEARQFGIHSAMPMARARRACPQLVVVAPDHGEYGRVSELVFAIFRDFTPVVEGLSLDEAFLDVSGLRRLYHHPVDVAQAIRTRIREELGLPASVGIGSTKLVAKLASDAAKPDGWRHVPAPDALLFLQAMPVRALWGVGEATYALLEGMGVERIGDLAHLDADYLSSRLGPTVGNNLLALARGEDPRRVIPDVAAKSVSVSETFATDLTTPEQIATEFVRQCDRLAGRLRRAGLRGRTISITVRYADFRTISRSLTLPHVTANAHELRRATEILTERVSWHLPVRLLGVEVSQLMGGDEPRQLGVGEEERWDQLGDAVEHIRNRFGTGSIKPARLQELSEKARRAGSD